MGIILGRRLSIDQSPLRSRMRSHPQARFSDILADIPQDSKKEVVNK